MLAAGLLAAGCGGSHGAAVASLGTTTSAGARTQPSSTGGVPRGGSFAAFATCMTAHGAPMSPGPGGRGVVITGGNPGSPQFNAARAACQKLLPGGGPPPLTPAQAAQRAKGLARLASCMRTHGVPGFPDPNGQGDLSPGSLERLDPSLPLFQTAYKACWSLFPKVGPQLRIGP